MIVPNKFTSLDKSVMGKINHLLLDDRSEISISELINLKLSKFTDVGELILALDVLYILEKIEIDYQQKVIKYVD